MTLLSKMNLTAVLLLFSGATLGVLSRWQVNNDFYANIIGTAILGVVLGLSLNSRVKLFFGAGFCSSFTTFSGWIMRCYDLISKRMFLEACFLIGQTFIFGLLMAAIGYWVGKQIRMKVLF